MYQKDQRIIVSAVVWLMRMMTMMIFSDEPVHCIKHLISSFSESYPMHDETYVEASTSPSPVNLPTIYASKNLNLISSEIKIEHWLRGCILYIILKKHLFVYYGS